MADLEHVGIYTVPSVWTSDFSDDMPNPYRRIVGIGHPGDAEISWAMLNPHDQDPNAVFDRKDAELEIIEMPSITAERLVSFFDRYFANKRRTKPIYSTWEHRVIEFDELYNCHRFGQWMIGDPAARDFDFHEDLVSITNSSPFEGNLPFGKRGVLGIPGEPWHSLIGLGEDTDECLQVLACEGHMGIDTYENTVDHYDPMRVVGVQIFA